MNIASGLLRPKILLAIAAALIATGATAATDGPAAAATEPIILVDLTDEFASIWDRDAELGDAERVALFRSEFARLLPGFFDHRRVGVEAERYDRHLLGGLRGYPEQRAGIAEVSLRFAALFAPAQASFEAEFGAFPEPQTIYLIHSLGEMDGGTRNLPGGNFLIFGADVIARLHLQHRIQPFFHHELFHIHHGRFFSGCGEAIWCSLWREGLATYAAHRLNPDATDAELLLEVPEPIRPAVEINRAEAVCAVLARLDSADPGDSRALYSFTRFNARLPPRFGYYVGYLVAAELGRTQTLQQLAGMPPAEVRPLLEAALLRLADCPA
jgi:hypothetical protein